MDLEVDEALLGDGEDEVQVLEASAGRLLDEEEDHDEGEDVEAAEEAEGAAVAEFGVHAGMV